MEDEYTHDEPLKVTASPPVRRLMTEFPVSPTATQSDALTQDTALRLPRGSERLADVHEEPLYTEAAESPYPRESGATPTETQKVGLTQDTPNVAWSAVGPAVHDDPAKVKVSPRKPTAMQNDELGQETPVRCELASIVTGADQDVPLKVAASSAPTAVQNEGVGHETLSSPALSTSTGADQDDPSKV